MGRSFSEKIISTFLKRDKILIFGLFSLAVVFFILPLKKFQKDLLETNSIQDARLYAESIESFRSIYTKEVVNKVLHRGIKVTHDFEGDANAIPLPISFSIMLGKEISKHLHGGDVQLYSAYPFPWRAQTGGLRDNFKREAWKAFQDKSKKEYIQFFSQNGVRYIRYAVPDIMRPSCIQCHNTNPQSPKKDWKVGDVRGVLEVKRPVGLVTQKIAQSYQQTVIALLSVITLFLIIIYFVLNMLRKKIIQLGKQADTIRLQEANLISTSRLSALGEMAGGIAHEINNPLGVISLSSSSMRKLLAKKQFEDSRLITCLDHIDHTTERIAKIIKSLRTVSRDATKDELEKCTLKEILSDCLDLSREKFNVHSITLKLDLDQPAFSQPFMGNKVQLAQVFLNLFSNSIDAIVNFPEKWISIEADLKENTIVINFKDSGKGIPPEIQDKIFEPFFTTKKAGKGTGLGLSISNGFIKRHKGTLKIDKDCPNTCFVIELPINVKEGKLAID